MARPVGALVDTVSEYQSIRITDSRRLFGPNLFSTSAGVVLDVACTTPDDQLAIAAWPAEVSRLAAALGWPPGACVIRASINAASLFFTAPLDGLMTATDVSERAWLAAEHRVAGTVAIKDFDVAPLVNAYAKERQTLQCVVEAERDAHAVGRTTAFNDDGLFVGSGPGGQRVKSLPPIPNVTDPRAMAGDVPIVLVTGSNGKTTTVRMVSAMWRAAGRRAGWSCSDGVWIGESQVESGDFSGPGGAVSVVSDPRVEAAVLECARGGMLRRGLAVTVVDGAVITNIAADHFGEYGIDSLDDLAEVKSIVTRALKPGAPVTLNADDVTLVALAQRLTCPVVWFSASDGLMVRRAHAHGARAATVRDGAVMLCDGTSWHSLAVVAEMPITYGGHADHNVANALAAALVAYISGVPIPAIRQTLHTFGAAPLDNPGRLQIRTLGGVHVVMDYAHNPDGLASLCRTAMQLPAERRLLLLGQAGDRDNAQLQALAAVAATALRFDRIVVKEMPSMLRGRAQGDTSTVLRDALFAAGVSPDIVGNAPTELDGVRQALQWARVGDQLILGIHADRETVYALIDTLMHNGWQAGQALPPA